MMTITIEDEQRIAERLRSTPIMSADEREAVTQLLAAIRAARLEGGRYVHAMINGARIPVIKLM